MEKFKAVEATGKLDLRLFTYVPESITNDPDKLDEYLQEKMIEMLRQFDFEIDVDVELIY